MIKFTVYGDPVAQGRPRFARRGNFVTTYDPKKSADYKQLVYIEACKVKPDVPLECALSMTVRTYRQIPKSFSKARKSNALIGLIRPTQRPDCSNLIKGLEDSLHGIIYKDDSQIVDLRVEKWYSEEPRVEVAIREVK